MGPLKLTAPTAIHEVKVKAADIERASLSLACVYNFERIHCQSSLFKLCDLIVGNAV